MHIMWSLKCTLIFYE